MGENDNRRRIDDIPGKRRRVDNRNGGGGGGPSTLYDPSKWDSMTNYWPLNEDANDIIGSADMTENGSPNYVSAVDQQGVEGDGTDDYLSNSSSNVIGSTDSYTVAGWMSMSQKNGLSVILGERDIGASNGEFALGYNGNSNDNLFTIVETVSDGILFLNGPVPSIDTKYHLASTFDGNNLRLYVDGSEVSASPVTTSQSTTTVGSQTRNTMIGDGDNNEFGDFNYIDEVAKFERVLSASEIDTLYQKGA